MVLSDIDLETVKNYLRVDFDGDDALIEACLASATKYAQDYTGLDEEDLDELPDIPLAVLALCADLYEQRQATVPSAQMNPIVAQILGAHSTTLL